MPDDTLKRFVFKHYIERKPMKQCGREMTYTERHVYRISNDVKKFAIKILLKELVTEKGGAEE